MTCNIENSFIILNTNYLNLNTFENKFNSFTFSKQTYEAIISERGFCNASSYGHFEQVLSSSQTEGYKKLETFIVKTRNIHNMLSYYECFISEPNCTCYTFDFVNERKFSFSLENSVCSKNMSIDNEAIKMSEVLPYHRSEFDTMLVQGNLFEIIYNLTKYNLSIINQVIFTS